MRLTPESLAAASTPAQIAWLLGSMAPVVSRAMVGALFLFCPEGRMDDFAWLIVLFATVHAPAFCEESLFEFTGGLTSFYQ